MFDEDDPAASRIILLSTYDTFANRTTAIIEKSGTKKKTYTLTWKGVFDTVVLDEGHKLRHPWTRAYARVKGLEARHHWFLTATPVVNNSKAGDLSPYQHGKTLMCGSRT